VTNDLNTLLTALYVEIDDWLDATVRIGRPPKLSDAELLTAAIWHNRATGQPITRSLIAYDH
jgi:hypothetical protein